MFFRDAVCDSERIRDVLAVLRKLAFRPKQPVQHIEVLTSDCSSGVFSVFVSSLIDRFLDKIFE